MSPVKYKCYLRSGRFPSKETILRLATEIIMQLQNWVEARWW